MMGEDSKHTLDYTMDVQTLHENLLSLASKNTRLEKENDELKKSNAKLLEYIARQDKLLGIQKANSDIALESQAKKQSLGDL